MNQELLKKKWISQDICSEVFTNQNDLLIFENKNKLLIPNDLRNYFLNLNGTNNSYDENFYRFFSFENFKRVISFYEDWKGIPDYSQLKKQRDLWNNVFIFCDYQFCLISYAVKLKNKESLSNEVYAICGGDYEQVSKSFSEFIEIYNEDPDKLLI